MKKIIIFFLLFQNLFSQDNLPNFSVKLLNNQSSNLVSLTNEISLISFWATWCLPCIKEIDKINTFVKDYDNTYFKHVYDVLSSKYKLGRMRILLKEPRSTLSWHRDPEPRLHIPIITNPGCIMVIDLSLIHI